MLSHTHLRVLVFAAGETMYGSTSNGCGSRARDDGLSCTRGASESTMRACEGAMGGLDGGIVAGQQRHTDQTRQASRATAVEEQQQGSANQCSSAHEDSQVVLRQMLSGRGPGVEALVELRGTAPLLPRSDLEQAL
eukprot:scaffold200404_cov20-Tisochrysis_lutea.AAC.1